METNSNSVSVLLKECRNVHSSNEKFQCFARVEHGRALLGDSGRCECVSGESISLDHRVGISCELDSHEALAGLAKNPLLVTLLEVLPKDKKAKEEKTYVLGQVSVDMLSFIRGATSQVSSVTIPLQSCSEMPITTDGQLQASKPEVDIEVTVPLSLIGSQEIAQSNILSLKLRSIHALPDSWVPGTFPYTFTLALPLPFTDTAHKGISLPQGSLKLGPDKDSSNTPGQWRWPEAQGTGPSTHVPDGSIQQHALEDEAGEINTKQDVKFRQTSECERPSVVWNTQHRAWLDPKAVKSMLSSLSQCPVWPVEIGRYTIPQSSGKGKAKEEEPVLSHHAVAYINMAPLLYPGATHICGAYSLKPFSEADISEKVGRPYSALLAQPLSAASGKKPAGGKRAGSSANKLSEPSGILHPDGTEPISEDSELKSEAMAYVEAKSYVVLELALEKPIIPKRPASVLADRINEYIPSRPALPRREGGIMRAVGDYHSKVSDIATVLLTEFRALFGEELSAGALSDGQDSVNERRKKLLFHLNSSGKYHAFKEQLKISVVKLVREKYLTQARTDNKEQLQQFLSELYVFLTDQIHTGLNKVLNLEDSAPPTPSPLDSHLLKTFAFEAEQLNDYQLARHYYKERVVCGDHVSECWFDYGVFSLLESDMDRAEQCFKETVALEQSHIPALLLYGMVCCLDERFSEAEHFFELATTAEPTNIIAWTMRGLYYELAGNGVYQDMCFQEANKLNLGHSAKTFISPVKRKRGSISQPPQGGGRGIGSLSRASISGKPGGSLKQQSTASVLGGPVTTGVGEAGGTPGLVESTNSVTSKESHKQQEPKTSKVLDDEPSTTDKPRAPTESVVNFSESQPQDDKSGAAGEGNLASGSGVSIRSGQSAPRSVTTPGAPPESLTGALVSQDTSVEESTPTIGIFLQTASYLLDMHALKFSEMALAHEVAGCDGDLGPVYLVTEARLHMHREQYHKALDSLKKAIILDYQDSTAWSLLGHCYYNTGDYSSAKDAYQRTVDYVNPPANVHTVLLRLADIYLRDKQYPEAKETYLRACHGSPTSQTWRGVGVACYHLGDLSQAEDALCEANILNNLDPTVWAYLTMLCLKTNRAVEAEQAYKFSAKVGLKDAVLLAEIQALQKQHSPTIELLPLPIH